MKNPVALAIKVAIGVVLLLVVFAFLPFFTVNQNERTIVTNWGEVNYAAAPGFHLRIPIVQSLITIPVDIRSVKIDKLNTYTVDSQELIATIVLQYRVPADKVIEIYSNLGTNYESKLESMVIDRFKTVLGQVNAIELASQRGAIAKRVLDSTRADAAKNYFGLDITDIQLVNIDWNDAFRTAISNASVAKAKVDQQEQEKRQAEVTAQQAVVVATGQANARLAQAEGEAKSIRVSAEAQAYATQKEGESRALALTAQRNALGANATAADIISYGWAIRWNGQLPTTTYGAAAPIPMLMAK